MCPLPNNEPRTTLGGKKSIVIFDSSSWDQDGPERTTLEGKEFFQLGTFSSQSYSDRKKMPNWIALYDGNAVDLIDTRERASVGCR